MLKVTFMAHRDGELASDRLRAQIPVEHLKQMGVDAHVRRPGDLDTQRHDRILVASKHSWNQDIIAGYRAVVFDVCDNHFEGPYGSHYRTMVGECDACVVSTAALSQRIHEVTGSRAIVIDDPYEIAEREVRIGDTLLWFGHALGLGALRDSLEQLKGRRLEICTNIIEGVTPCGVTEYSQEALALALVRAGLVILPVGDLCKSANRAVHAIRAGRMPICHPMPAYDELSAFVPVAPDLGAGVAECIADKRRAAQRLVHAQQYVDWRFDPRRIALQWYNLLRRL